MTRKEVFQGSRRTRTEKRRRRRAMIADEFGLRGITPSESRSDVAHTTTIDEFGFINCSCEDAMYRHPRQNLNSPRGEMCKHARLLVAALVDAHRLRGEVA